MQNFDSKISLSVWFLTESDVVLSDIGQRDPGGVRNRTPGVTAP